MCCRVRVWLTLALTWSVCAGSLAPVQAQQPTAERPAGKFVDHVYRDADGEHKYVVFEPVGYTPDKKWPTIFYLHGASGRGKDGRAQLVVGLGPAVKARAETLPFLVVFPQNENLRSRLLGGWNDGSGELPRALAILDEVEKNYSVDKDHEVLVGVSMGAFGVWEVAANSPERWKAMIAVSGGGEPEFIPQLAKLPIWAFHAADDQLVPPTRSSDYVAEINQAGGRAFVSILPTGGHNIGAQVLARDEVFHWMEHPEQDPVTDIDWSQRSEAADMTDEVRFVPGADVASAARIRINRDLLESLSYVMADEMPADALQGWKPGRTETQRAGIATINVQVGGMHYNGQMEKAWIEPLPNGQMRVQLGLRNLTMTITGTQLQSRLLRANAGPMAIYIGHREPVWLTVDIAPQVVDRRLKLQATAIHFQIPNHNWSISRPGVDVRGLRFLEGRIADRLVDGIAEKKWMIEQEIRNSVPQMLAQIEQRVDQFCERTVTYRQWPMPLWQPRFRFYPESVSVDENGLELKLGAYVAALAPKSLDIPIRPFPATDQQFPQPSGKGLDLAVSLRLIDAYATLLSASEVAGFHVLDMNGPEFRQMGRHAFWNDVLPEKYRLPETTELNTEFVVVQPFQLLVKPGYEDDASATALQHHLALRIPQMQLRLAVKPEGEKDWTDYAKADLSFDQGLKLDIEKLSYSRRRLEIGFEPVTVPEVRAELLVDNAGEMLDARKISEAFYNGWSKNFGQAERDGTLNDIQRGQFTLRWQDLGATNGHMVVRLVRPGMRIHNNSSTAITYQVRASDTAWSPTLTLEPGKLHEFTPATPMTWRSPSPQGEQVFTLPLGFEAELRDTEGTVRLFQRREPKSAQQTAGRESVPQP